MELAELQQLFWRLITWPEGVADFMARADAATVRQVEDTFAETAGFSRVERLEVYAEAYFWRLYKVLADQFPVTAWLVGAPRFRNLITDYLLSCPSVSPDVGAIGARLPGFVAGHEVAARVDGLADVAAVEWAFAEALHGPDDAAATVADLAAVPLDAWPTLELRAVATARLLPCRHDVAALRGTVAAATDARPPVPVPLPAAAAGVILVWRKGFAATMRAPAGDEARALAMLTAGARFDAIAAAAAEPATAVAWLERWLGDELVAGLGLLATPG